MFDDVNFKKIFKFGSLFIIFLLVIFTIFGGFYTVGEQEQAVVTMFGKIVRTDNAGLYFKIPWIQSVKIVNVSTNGTTIGYKEKDGKYTTIDNEGIMITSDFNFVNLDFYLEYKVSDPVAYLYSSTDPVGIMRNMVLSCIRNTVINYTVDDVITTGKSQIQAEVKEKITQMLADTNIGLQIVNITVQDAEPPTKEIVDAFKAVETAKQGKETEINRAKKYESEEMPKAIAESDKIIQDAEAIKATRVAEAKGQVARFEHMFSQYKLQPMITKQRIFFETMEEVLPNLKVIVTNDNNNIKLFPLDQFAK